MRKGVSGVRRIAAILSVSLVTLLVTGTGAGAAVAPKLVNYSSVGTGQVLGLHIQLPSALDSVLGAAHLSSKIDQVVSFSRSIGQVDKTANVGTGLGQVMDGTLNPLLDSIANIAFQKTLPRVFATLGESVKHDTLAEINDPTGLLHVGVMEVNAVSSLKTAADGLKGVVSHSDSKILGLKIDLGTQLTSTLKSVLQPVLDVTDSTGGLIDTINTGLNTVENTVNSTLGLDLNLDLPKLESLLSQPLVTVGLIETGSDTGLAGIARTAKGVTRLANVDVLGSGDNALVHIDSLSTETGVSIDGTKGGAAADAVSRILGLKILGNTIDLTKGALKVNGKSFALPLDTVLTPLTELLKTTLGLKIDLFSTSKSASATHAVAEAKTLSISLAPLNGALGLSLGIDGPLSMAEVQGSTVQELELPTPLPTTGVPTTAYFLAGPALLGMAVLVRKFALSH
jgi:hypothetical protein